MVVGNCPTSCRTGTDSTVKFSRQQENFAVRYGLSCTRSGEAMTNNSELSWRDQVREQLNNRPATLKIEDLAEAINVSETWLRLFARGKIPNPGVMTVEALSKYLTNYNKKG